MPVHAQSHIYRGSRFSWVRLKFAVIDEVQDNWNTHPYGDTLLLDEMENRTTIDVDKTWNVVSLENLDELIQYPFVFMTTEGSFKLSEKEHQNLAEYLKRGGFIFADDCVLRGQGDGFFRACRKYVEDKFDTKMVQLNPDHEIFHCYYNLPNGLPHCQGVKHGAWALYIDGRMAMFLSPSDLHCGWASLYLNKERRRRLWFPKKTCIDAVKMGVNVVVYAMSH